MNNEKVSKEYQKKERTKCVPASYILLLREGKILLARRANTGYQDGNWNVPSGHVDGNELPAAAAVRECLEEIGVRIREKDLVPVHISYRPKHDDTGNRVDFFFSATEWEGEPGNLEPNKCDALEWFPTGNLPDKMTPHVRDAIESMLKGIFFRELSLQWLKEEGVYDLPN